MASGPQNRMKESAQSGDWLRVLRLQTLRSCSMVYREIRCLSPVCPSRTLTFNGVDWQFFHNPATKRFVLETEPRTQVSGGKNYGLTEAPCGMLLKIKSLNAGAAVCT